MHKSSKLPTLIPTYANRIQAMLQAKQIKSNPSPYPKILNIEPMQGDKGCKIQQIANICKVHRIDNITINTIYK